MGDFLRWWAELIGVELEPGTEVQFELASFPSGGLGLLVLLGCLGALLAIAFFYRRDGKNLRTWQRVVLAGLRIVAVIAAIFVLLEPNIVTVERETRPGHTLLLVDVSQSMNQVDSFRREEVRSLAEGWRELGVEDPRSTARIDMVRALLGHDGGALVSKLGEKNVAQLYGFAGNLEHLPLLPPPPPALDENGEPIPVDPDALPPRPRLDLGKLVADGRFTNLGGSLRAALDRSRGSEIAAVVILGDGRRNAGPQGAEVARLLARRKIPHTFVLGIGDPSETQTVELVRHEAPNKVFQKDEFEMKSFVATQGYDPTTVTVRLVRVDEKGTEVTVGSQQIEVGGPRSEVEVPWHGISSDMPGRFLFRAELVPPDGEALVPERHTKTVAVEVLEEKARVLLLAGASTYEYQMLRNQLIRDKTIAVTCWVQNADESFPQDGNEGVRIERLPEGPEEFDPYDVAILIDPDPSRLTKGFCEQLARHVVEGGCGLWWVAGEKFTHAALVGTASTSPLADLLPVVPDIEYAQRKMALLGKAFPRPVAYALAPGGGEGLGAKISQIADGKDVSRMLWGKLPGFYFWFPVKGIKPAATVVVESTAQDPRFRRDGHGMPLIAIQNVGAGRVLYSGTDDTYRWGAIYREAYQRFWVGGIRYLYEGRANAGNSRLRLFADADKIDLGEAITISAEVKDEALQPLIADSFEVEIDREGRSSETVHLLATEGVPGGYELRFRPTQIGTYRVRPVAKIGPNTEIGFQVVPARVEREGPMNRAELAAVAGVAGGELFDRPLDLLAAVDRIPSRSAVDVFRTPHPVWDGWPTILFLLAVLSLEWILRKRFNLL